MPALITLCCIVLFFVILFTVRINVRVAMKDDMTLALRVLGIPIKILPKKEKTYNPKDYTLGKIRKRDAKAAEKAAKAAEKKRKKKEEKERKKAERPPSWKSSPRRSERPSRSKRRPPVLPSPS